MMKRKINFQKKIRYNMNLKKKMREQVVYNKIIKKNKKKLRQKMNNYKIMKRIILYKENYQIIKKNKKELKVMNY